LRYQCGFCYFFFFLNEITLFLQILLQDKYNIGVLMVNIEFMWLGTKQMERFAKAHLSPVSKPRHMNSIFIVNTPILYIYTPTQIMAVILIFFTIFNIARW
jgi:hypothetical protein